MKVSTMKKKLLLGGIVLCLAGGLVIAQNQSSSSSAAEIAEESFTDMTKEERMTKLTELRNAQSAAGNLQAAAYLQGRIDFLSNQ